MAGWLRELKKLVRNMVRAETAEIRTHFPAKVEEYTAATNTCTIQPCIKAIRTEDAGNMTTIGLTVLKDVPVRQHGSGKLLVSLAPQAGSYGYCHVSDRCLEQWILNGGVVDPGSARRWDISDVWFDPGGYPLMPEGDNGLLAVPVATDRISLRTRLGLGTVSVLDDDTIEITTAAGTVTMDAAGVITLENATQSLEVGATAVAAGSGTGFVAMATKVDTLWTTLYTLLTTWTPVPMDGGAAFKTAAIAAFPTPPTSVASTNLKAE